MVEGENNSSHRIKSKKVIATGLTAPEIEARMDSYFSGAALDRGFLPSENRFMAERVCLLESLNHCEMEIEHSKRIYW